MYIIQILKKINSNHFIWKQFQFEWIFRFYVFVMFKMKYLINRMQCNILSQQMGWLDVRVFVSIIKIKGSNLSNGVYVANSGELIEYSPI
jgi:hypothetical protein